MNKLLKSFLLGGIAICLVAGGAIAAPYVTQGFAGYEYYQSEDESVDGHPAGQLLAQGQAYDFFFDLADLNPGNSYMPEEVQPSGTNSELSLINDVSGFGSSFNPIDSVWATIALWSGDSDFESFDIDITAFSNDQTYDLYSGAHDVSRSNGIFGIFSFEFSDDLQTAWQNDPSGLLKLSVIVNPDGLGWNDYKLLEIGIGVNPVPEPATMLLLGMGLLGLAGITRKKIKA